MQDFSNFQMALVLVVGFIMLFGGIDLAQWLAGKKAIKK